MRMLPPPARTPHVAAPPVAGRFAAPGPGTARRSPAADRRAQAIPPPARRRPRPPSASDAADATEAAAAVLEGAVPAPTGAPPDPRPGARPFSVPLAIGLASAAFDAYYEALDCPGPALRDADGCETKYIAAPVMRQAARSTLALTLERADGLPAADAWGTSDPYAIVSCGAASFRSTTVKRTLAPAWGEPAELYVADPDADELTVAIFDADILNADDPLGEASIPVSKLDGGPVTLPLTAPDGSPAGTVTLAATLIPLSDADVAQRASGALGDATGCDEIARMTASWRALAARSGDVAVRLFEPVAFIENAGTDTQAWVGFNPGLRAIVLAFRGTEMTKLADVLSDINVIPTGFDPADPTPAHSRVLKRASLVDVPEDGLWVHSGFRNAYASVRSSVWRVVDECMAAGGGGAPWRVYLTGHSLGGALATLAAFDAAATEFASGSVEGLTLYTFGSPRVGNGAFAAAFDRAVPDAWRVTNANDVIARIPRAIGYRHIGHAVGLKRDGSFDADAGDVLEGETPVDAARNFVGAAVAAAMAGDAGALTATVNQEIDMAKALASGDALADHREAFYFETLRKVVDAFVGDGGDDSKLG